MNRREWLGRIAAGLGLVAAGCKSLETQGATGAARLPVRFHGPSAAVRPGVVRLGLAEVRDGLLYVPSTYQANRPAPLIVMLHGAGDGAAGITQMPRTTDQYGTILLVPDSRGPTWDMRLGGFGPDIDFIGRALDATFSRCNVLPDRMGLFGFSDGASYALSVGLANGDLFTHIGAFSPGYMVTTRRVGRPRIFVAHGTGDAVLPIALSRDNIVPRLEQEGYDVRYHVFDGGHAMQAAERDAAMKWFVNSHG